MYRRRNCYSHFTSEESRVQRRYKTCPGQSPSSKGTAVSITQFASTAHPRLTPMIKLSRSVLSPEKNVDTICMLGLSY